MFGCPKCANHKEFCDIHQSREKNIYENSLLDHNLQEYRALIHCARMDDMLYDKDGMRL